jgi:hypothetical protein
MKGKKHDQKRTAAPVGSSGWLGSSSDKKCITDVELQGFLGRRNHKKQNERMQKVGVYSLQVADGGTKPIQIRLQSFPFGCKKYLRRASLRIAHGRVCIAELDELVFEKGQLVIELHIISPNVKVSHGRAPARTLARSTGSAFLSSACNHACGRISSFGSR